jgi:hypothetical protein
LKRWSTVSLGVTAKEALANTIMTANTVRDPEKVRENFWGFIWLIS